MAVESGAHTLIVIAASHYVERARWALDLAGIQYVEDRWPPVLHVFGLRSYGVVKTTSLPVLVLPSKRKLTDSQDILDYAHAAMGPASPLYPSDPEQLRQPPGMPGLSVKDLELLFSKKLGAMARVMVYQVLFTKRALMLRVIAEAPGTPLWRIRLFSTLAGPFTFLMRRTMNVNADNAAKCTASLPLQPVIAGSATAAASDDDDDDDDDNNDGDDDERTADALGDCQADRRRRRTSAPLLSLVKDIFAFVSGLLADGRPYLVAGTTRPSAVDITFAALGAPVVLPPSNYGGSSGVTMMTVEDMGPDFAATELRQTLAGQHLLKMYALHRLPAAEAPSPQSAAAPTDSAGAPS
ncbi:hypothetical protein QJQ45_029998 [Haematococcus lacustris]|nr:hypothetical protein QJQ45_029998 [Haematococcus lacustris]